jgi:predicted ATPase
MTTRIIDVTPNLLNGLFTSRVNIEQGLTIIAGENGTGKSRFLESVKQKVAGITYNPEAGGVEPVVVAFSPKRNSTKTAFRNLVNESITQNRKLDNRVNELINRAFHDNTYTDYPSFSEMFFHAFRRNDSEGSTVHIEAMNKTVEEFNKVIKSVFNGVELQATWNGTEGTPDLMLKKQQLANPIEIQEVSTGEQEILSLIFNINIAAESSDVILIDEPELHLNWGLEQNLFKYFKSFANEHDVQIIVATHSRVISLPEFIKNIRYFYWDDGRVRVSTTMPAEKLAAIAGEAVQFVQAMPDTLTTIFVEDVMQKHFITSLCNLYGKDVGKLNIVISHDKGTVNNLFKALKDHDEVNDSSLSSFFLVDGDGDEKITSQKYFIQLKKYSIESYFFGDLDILKKVSNVRTSRSFEKILIRELKNYKLKRDKKQASVFEYFMKYSSMDDNILKSKIFDLIDCKTLVKALGVGNARTVDEFVMQVGKIKADKLFDKELIAFIKNI